MQRDFHHGLLAMTATTEFRLPQLADPGAVLTAGSAPSDVVCWLVGRAGAVLRTSDGTTWARLPAPAPDDLVQIEAEDARTATVTTAGGVSFRTVDGGQTWATP